MGRSKTADASASHGKAGDNKPPKKKRRAAHPDPIPADYPSSVRDYVTAQKAGTLTVPLPTCNCPACGAAASFAYYGWTPRTVVCIAAFMPDGTDGIMETWMRRVRCLHPGCGRTFTILPTFRAAVQALCRSRDLRLCA